MIGALCVRSVSLGRTDLPLRICTAFENEGWREGCLTRGHHLCLSPPFLTTMFSPAPGLRQEERGEVVVRMGGPSQCPTVDLRNAATIPESPIQLVTRHIAFSSPAADCCKNHSAPEDAQQHILESKGEARCTAAAVVDTKRAMDSIRSKLLFHAGDNGSNLASH